MKRFKNSYNHYVKAVLVVFFLCLIAGVLLITMLDSSVLNSSFVEWIAIFCLSVGFTAIYAIYSANSYKKSYIEVHSDKVVISGHKEKQTIKFSDIKTAYLLKAVFLVRSSKIRIETSNAIYTVYLSEQDAQEVLNLLPDTEKDSGEKIFEIKLSLKDKLKTLYIKLANVVLYMTVFCMVVIPPMFGVLSRYSKDYQDAKAVFVLGCAIIWLSVCLYIIIDFIVQTVRFKNYKLTIYGDRIALNYFYLGKKSVVKDRSEVLSLSVLKSVFATVFGYGFVSFTSVSKKNGLGDVNYFPFALPNEVCQKIVQTYLSQDPNVKMVTPEKKHYVSGYAYLALVSVISVAFALMYHVGFLTFILLGVIVLFTYIRGRSYGVGEDFLTFTTGGLWKRRIYVKTQNVKAVSFGKEAFLRKVNAGSLVIYLCGYGSEITLGVFGDELRLIIKDKLNI